MTRRPRTKEEHLVTVKLITHAYLQMGVIASGKQLYYSFYKFKLIINILYYILAAGFFAYFTTMYYFGFTMSGMFGL